MTTLRDPTPRIRLGAPLALALALVACGPPSPSTETSPPTPSPATASPSSSPAPLSTAPSPTPDAPFALHLRTTFARSHLGPDALVTLEPPSFLLVAPSATRSFAPSVALVHSALPALFNARFRRRLTPPTPPVTIYLFDDAASYGAFCRSRYGNPCASPLGIYDGSTREVVADQHYGVTTALHELVHALLDDDFPRAPVWLREGISALYETPVIAGDAIHGATGWRLPSLRKALGSSDGIAPRASLEALFSMPPNAFRDQDALTAYAVARFACMWLDSPGQDHLWTFYRTWRDHAAQDPTGEKSFAEVVGRSPHDANEAWRKWVTSL